MKSEEIKPLTKKEFKNNLRKFFSANNTPEDIKGYIERMNKLKLGDDSK